MSKELFHKSKTSYVPKELYDNWQEVYKKERLVTKILKSLTFEESKYNELKISFMYILYDENPGYIEIQCEIKGYKC